MIEQTDCKLEVYQYTQSLIFNVNRSMNKHQLPSVLFVYAFCVSLPVFHAFSLSRFHFQFHFSSHLSIDSTFTCEFSLPASHFAAQFMYCISYIVHSPSVFQKLLRFSIDFSVNESKECQRMKIFIRNTGKMKEPLYNFSIQPLFM